MKLIKVQKQNCPACELVEGFLKDAGVAYDKVDVYEDPSIAMELGVMTVPITVVKDDSDKIVASSLGFKPDELEKLVDMVK